MGAVSEDPATCTPGATMLQPNKKNQDFPAGRSDFWGEARAIVLIEPRSGDI